MKNMKLLKQEGTFILFDSLWLSALPIEIYSGYEALAVNMSYKAGALQLEKMYQPANSGSLKSSRDPVISRKIRGIITVTVIPIKNDACGDIYSFPVPRKVKKKERGRIKIK